MSLASGEHGQPVTGQGHRRPAEDATVPIAQSSVLERVNCAIDPVSNCGQGHQARPGYKGNRP